MEPKASQVVNSNKFLSKLEILKEQLAEKEIELKVVKQEVGSLRSQINNLTQILGLTEISESDNKDQN